MPDLIHSLLHQDIGHLRIIAELWGLDLESTDSDSARDELSASLLDVNLLADHLASLPPEADSAIAALIASNGRIAWAIFARQFGDIREMGAGKRDREHPHRNPTSTSEILFYRGILARAFFDTNKGSQEFAYIPDDLFKLMKEESDALSSSKGEKNLANFAGLTVNNSEPLGRPASPNEKGTEILADDSILDDATTLLAALRIGRSNWSRSIPVGQFDLRLIALLASANLISPSPAGRGARGEGEVNAEEAKTFLEASRADALKTLYDAWLESDRFNELKLMPNIICEGEWKNSPRDTRRTILGFINAIPTNKWWSVASFVQAIKQTQPDFQRPAGDYDSWFIKRASDGQYLRGFDSWNEVDGALIRYFINILHWLGRLDLNFAENATEATSFRLSSFQNTKEERGKITASSNGKVSVERFTPRVVRYQIARFCEWEDGDFDMSLRKYPTSRSVYKYHITAKSLKHAKEQGLKAEQLLSLLVKHTDNKVPPPLVKALKRWDANGTQARAETQTILRVSQPEVLEEMRKSKAGKFLGEILSPTAVVVKNGAIQKVMEAMIELGLFAEIHTNPSLRANEVNEAIPYEDNVSDTTRGLLRRNERSSQ
ncbi:MAG: helicase-associated domain-containing protein [Anaerolineales bacterium]|nr:helicase-associated domain-containing protein [Anaerolineales bacterium]MCL4259330.1 helicase-associated domain-containing protein [Anaerolineales bacterium]